MTVKELIEKLQQYDPDTLVVVDSQEGDTLEDAEVFGILPVLKAEYINTQRYDETVNGTENSINVLLIH